ncbi:MAG TPA: capsule assembly Wzi family protein, partial [Gammaproteobacteria bacterium]|nr:capsule assembly Wzi family protein [Gammaproteobacteria bacterium]
IDLNVQGVDEPADGEDVRADGSEIGLRLGNFTLAASTMERWWGPGWDGSLILSTNARPTPQIAISRNSAQPFASRWLRWIGPWTLTSFIGQLDDARVVDDALLFGLRFTFKPLPSLEIGLSRTAQWCGDGRSCDLSTFGDLLLGLDNRGENVDAEDEPGNQLGGFDVRWALPWLDRSTALYAQWIGEDTRQGGPQIGSWLRQIGAEYSGTAFDGRWSHRSYLEYSDTVCREGGLGFSDKKFNCAYEHAIYRTGYRYERMSVGHGMDSDGTIASIGSIWQGGQDLSWQFSARHIDTNQSAAPSGNHTISPIRVEIDELLAVHERPLWVGWLRVALGYRDTRYPDDASLDDNSAFGWIEFVVR